jgi:hypothetical protein
MASTLDLLKLLNKHQVQYVLVGGMACIFHGSLMVTQDVDVCSPSIQVGLDGVPCRILDLDTLITAKKAMNSPKDRQAVIELEAIRERLRIK